MVDENKSLTSPSAEVLLRAVPEQFKVVLVVFVEPSDLLVVQFFEQFQYQIVRVGPLAGVSPLGFDHVPQLAHRYQVVLVLLQGFEFGYHIVVEETGRTEVRHRYPVHVDLGVRMPDLVQQVIDKLRECGILLSVPRLKSKGTFIYQGLRLLYNCTAVTWPLAIFRYFWMIRTPSFW